jgi:hypothetical protein
VALLEMKYSRHEFIKSQELGTMIAEAMQSVIDRMNKKEKILLETKY